MSKKVSKEDFDGAFIISQVKNRDRELQSNGISEEISTGQAEPDLPDKVLQKNKEQYDKDIAPDDNRRRRSKAQVYESLFIKESSITTRSGKAVYIRKEHHDLLLKIVQVIGGNEVSLFSYIDNVLENHFAAYEDEISELYNKKHTGVFKKQGK